MAEQPNDDEGPDESCFAVAVTTIVPRPIQPRAAADKDGHAPDSNSLNRKAGSLEPISRGEGETAREKRRYCPVQTVANAVEGIRDHDEDDQPTRKRQRCLRSMTFENASQHQETNNRRRLNRHAEPSLSVPKSNTKDQTSGRYQPPKDPGTHENRQSTICTALEIRRSESKT
ncbi:hypothetical protein IL306_012429 [Fusarium sp. DS 682]|nr:hypothetical protein IL306_012429 [Fusarium sp. DS 682]